MKNFLKSVDIFDKYSNEEYKLTTKSSSVMSLLFTIFCTLLLLYDFSIRLQTKFIRDLITEPQLINDQESVNVSLSLLVNMPCYFLHLDVIDSIGSSQLNINTTAKFRRIDKNNNFIGFVNETISSMCMPCLGLLPEGYCCNSCEEIVLLHYFRGLIPNPATIPQCNNKLNTKVDQNEKCHIKGKVVLNKVNGNFHIAPGKNVPKGNGAIHDLSGVFSFIDLTHTFYEMRIGPKLPMTNNPLNGYGQRQIPQQKVSFDYHLIVTPVFFVSRGTIIARGYDYTAKLDTSDRTSGIYFHYSFTPYSIKITPLIQPFTQFFISTSGFFAGIFALLTLIDETLVKKPEPKTKEETK